MDPGEDHGESARESVGVEDPGRAGFSPHHMGRERQPPHDRRGGEGPGHDARGAGGVPGDLCAHERLPCIAMAKEAAAPGKRRGPVNRLKPKLG